MRLLGAARLSRGTDESTSIATQRTQITKYADLHGHTLVAITEDVDTSGAVSPFDRPFLAPWLTDRLAEWDGLIVAKLDRLSRSMRDFVLFIDWAAEHGKVIISIGDGIDLSSPMGKAQAQIAGVFAELERGRIAERITESAKALRHAGRWGGGKPPYGYRALELPDGGKRLVTDPDTAAVVRGIVTELVAGASMSAVCRKLNDDHVPTPKGAPAWKPSTIAAIVRSRTLIGERVFQGRPVREPDGQVVMITDTPLLTEQDWAELQEAMAALAKPHGGGHKTQHLLLRVAFCGRCGAPMYHHRFAHRADNYRCGASCSPSVETALLEGLVEHDLLTHYGDEPIMKRAARLTDHAAVVAALERQITELQSDRYEGGLFSGDFGTRRYRKLMAELEEQLVEAERRAASTSDADQWEPTGQTVRQRWESSDAAGRHATLLKLGITWEVWQEARSRVSDHKQQSRTRLVSSWQDPAQCRERLQRMLG